MTLKSAPSGGPALAAPGAPARLGLLYGVTAYGLWAVIPLYWRLLRAISPWEILAHRMVWGLGVLLGLTALAGAGPAVWAALRDGRAVRALLLSGLLLSANWLTFIHAVTSDQLISASLGYFINPLVSVLLGAVVLGERLRRLQGLAIALAALGVVQIAVWTGGLPWIALTLAATFGSYGLIRKTAPVEALAGSTVETLFLAPLGALYLGWLAATGQGALGHQGLETNLLLAATGVVTAGPLVLFSAAARRLPLSTVGFLQYITPTGQLLVAVCILGEPFDHRRLLAFCCIWAGLAVFSVDLWRHDRASRRGRSAP